MNAERYTFDTNLLFYALDPDSSEKHRVASHLITAADPERAILLLQTLGELCNSVRRKRPALTADAHRWVRQSMVFFDVQAAVPADLAAALLAQQQHHLPFWDAMLWAAAQRTNCTLLLSEDFNDGQQLGSVLLRNPFNMNNADLDKLVGS